MQLLISIRLSASDVWVAHHPSGSEALRSRQCAGEKLIEHLKAWLEPEKLAAQECAWSPGQAPLIAAAILELFHLLPPQAAGFLHSKGADAVSFPLQKPSVLMFLPKVAPFGRLFQENSRISRIHDM
jgi:hypothetical protein